MENIEQIIKTINDEVKNKKAKSTLLAPENGHPTPFFHTRDSILNLVIKLLETVKNYDNGKYQKEKDENYIYAEVEDTFFASVSDQFIQGLYIFDNYNELFNTLIKFKENEQDYDAIQSIKYDPAISKNNFE